MDARGVDRELRAKIWPALKRHGFERRASRIAWRYDDGVDLVEISSIGSSGDAIGCTSFSITAWVAAIPSFIKTQSPFPDRDGQLRPHYWHCQLHRGLRKTLHQPWFRPFAQPRPNLPPSLAIHREGLKHVVRRDIHDRPDIWFIREDGSNIAEVMDDLMASIEGEGLPAIERFHDPSAVIEMARIGELGAAPGSPAANELVRAAQAALGDLS